jgi:hypothetical protein
VGIGLVIVIGNYKCLVFRKVCVKNVIKFGHFAPKTDRSTSSMLQFLGIIINLQKTLKSPFLLSYLTFRTTCKNTKLATFYF